MRFDAFVRGFNQAKDKGEYAKKHVTTTYIAYESKIADCNKIFTTTSYTEVEGRKIFKLDSPSREMLMAINFIKRYTDIEVPQEGSKMLELYNALEQVGAMVEILRAIPATELAMYQKIMDMTIDDVMVNTRDLVSYIDSKMEAFGMMFDGVQEAVAGAISERMSEIGNED